MTIRRAAAGLLATVCVTLCVAGTARAQEAAAPRDTARWTGIGALVSYTAFGGDTKDWQLYALSFTHHQRSGSLIGRVNVASRFGTTGTQVEGDAWHMFDGGRYMYLNAGYSGSSVFPTQRAGVEFYQNLPGAWEASLGARGLWFDGTPVTLLTGTVGKYFGNSWASARPFVRFKDSGVATSLTLISRRYGADANHYIGGRVTMGSSPTDRITPDAIGRTNSLSIGMQGALVSGRSLFATWDVGYDAEELSATRTRRGWTLTVGLTHRK